MNFLGGALLAHRAWGCRTPLSARRPLARAAVAPAPRVYSAHAEALSFTPGESQRRGSFDLSQVDPAWKSPPTFLGGKPASTALETFGGWDGGGMSSRADQGGRGLLVQRALPAWGKARVAGPTALACAANAERSVQCVTARCDWPPVQERTCRLRWQGLGR